MACAYCRPQGLYREICGRSTREERAKFGMRGCRQLTPRTAYSARTSEASRRKARGSALEIAAMGDAVRDGPEAARELHLRSRGTIANKVNDWNEQVCK